MALPIDQLDIDGRAVCGTGAGVGNVTLSVTVPGAPELSQSRTELATGEWDEYVFSAQGATVGLRATEWGNGAIVIGGLHVPADTSYSVVCKDVKVEHLTCVWKSCVKTTSTARVTCSARGYGQSPAEILPLITVSARLQTVNPC